MDEASKTVQEIIKQMLDGMRIRQVVSIDDYYAPEDSRYAYAITLFQQARASRDIEFSELIPRAVLEAPEDLWTRQLERIWSDTEHAERLEMLNELVMKTGSGSVSIDATDLSHLRKYIPQDMFIALDPDGWDRDRDAILSNAQDNHKVLCLFDQDLRHAGRSESAGISLLQQALGVNGAGNVICGLLTQTIGKDQELSKAREFANENGLGLDEFLPLSKERLRGDPTEFADGLKLILLNFVRERLSRRVAEITKQASEAAQKQMNELNVYDFEHIVIRSSELDF